MTLTLNRGEISLLIAKLVASDRIVQNVLNAEHFDEDRFDTASKKQQETVQALTKMGIVL